MILRRLALVFLASMLTLAARAGDVMVFAAASLSEPLQEIALGYEPAGGDRLRFNFGASSLLAVQITRGAPADVFFSADEAKMNELDRAGLIATDTRRSLLSNTLVIVVNAGDGAAVTRPDDLAAPAVRRLALAETRTVPAGIYAREYLEKTGLWAKVAGKVVPTENVRACLAAVEAGNADAGIVYKTDVFLSKRVKTVHEVPTTEGPAISYPIAVVKESKNPGAARAFVRHLASPAARAVFTKYGFPAVP